MYIDRILCWAWWMMLGSMGNMPQKMEESNKSLVGAMHRLMEQMATIETKHDQI